MIRQFVLVAAGGAVGALARYGISVWVQIGGAPRFPVATLGINAVGSLAIGVLYVLIAERAMMHPDWRSAAMIGFLGAFTTFSTFSLETVTLLEGGRVAAALAYMGLSVLLCVGGAWFGIWLARVAAGS